VCRLGKVECYRMPETQADVLELVRSIRTMADLEKQSVVCVMEEVPAYVGLAQPGAAMFRFGEHCGFLEGVVQALRIKLVLVRPRTWQKGFGLGTAASCGSKREWKGKLRAEAQRRFPHLRVTMATADALLILEYAQGAVGVAA